MRRDVVGGGGLVGRAALAHDERAHGAVRDLRGDVEGARELVEHVEVLADGLPVPADGLAQRRAGDAFDAFHEADEPVVAVGRGGANPTPQLPITTVVTPCQIDGVSSGSHVAWPS